MSAYAGMWEFLCAYLIPDVLFYRDIRDCIYNSTTFEINYISGIFVIHATCMFIKLLRQYNKEKTIDKNNMSYTVLAENILNNGSTIKS